MPWKDSSADNWLYADEDAIYKITPSSVEIPMKTGFSAAFKTGWQGDVLNGVAVMNNGIDNPQYTDTDTNFNSYTDRNDYPNPYTNTYSDTFRSRSTTGILTY